MRTACPACGAVYEIPDERLVGKPRRLRCARCTSEWQVEMPAAFEPSAPVEVPPAAEAIAVPQPVPAALDRVEPQDPRPAATVAPARSDRRAAAVLGLAWVASGLAIVGALAGFVAAPATVTGAFPPAARLYAALGIDASAAAPTPD